MNSPVTESTPRTAMSRAEVRASASLASIFALRMLGLFLILPVFAVYAKGLSGGQSAAMVGLAMGMYGLVQSLGQIPFGMAADKFGRKPVIVVGLLLFALGSFVAAGAHDLGWIMVGRAIQGAGAISAAVTALIADSTREEHRTKAMAMVGGSIGLTFALSLVVSPLLYHYIGMAGIFSVTGVLALAAIGVVLFVVPAVPMVTAARVPFGQVLRHAELMRLNAGVFVLHMSQMAMFVVLPATLVQYVGLPVAEHWKIYLPVVLASFLFMLPPVFIGEKRGMMKQVFMAAITLLLLVQLALCAVLAQPLVHGWMLVVLLLMFFIAFNILEACQPSLVSRLAPPAAKGTALGIYNTLQSLGLFCGGALGGVLKQYAGTSAVFLMCGVATLTWLIIATNMKNLPRRGAASATA